MMPNLFLQVPVDPPILKILRYHPQHMLIIFEKSVEKVEKLLE